MNRFILLAALLLAVAISACGEAPDPVGPRPSPTPIIEARTTPVDGFALTDMAGREVTVPREPARFVALSPAAAQFLLALGIQPVGRPSDAAVPELASVPEVGSTLSPDFPAIDALDPDIVIADAAFHRARYRDFDQFPHPVYVIRAESHQGVLDTFAALGKVTGRQDAAHAAVAAIDERVEAVLVRLSGAPKPSVLIITGSGRDLYAGTDATYIGSLVTLLGADNVLGEAPSGAPLPGFGPIELGEAAALDPDVVLVIVAGEGGLAEAIRTSAEWVEADAVASGRIHELDMTLFLRSPGPGVAEAVELLASLLYPGR